MTVLMLLFILAAIVLIDTPLVAWLMFVDKRKTIAIVGISISLVIFLIGSGLSVFFHVLHMAFSGDLAKSPLFYGLAFTVIATAPLITITIARLQKQGRPGYCGKCGYDLRGSKNSDQCPECGERILRHNLV